MIGIAAIAIISLLSAGSIDALDKNKSCVGVVKKSGQMQMESWNHGCPSVRVLARLTFEPQSNLNMTLVSIMNARLEGKMAVFNTTTELEQLPGTGNRVIEQVIKIINPLKRTYITHRLIAEGAPGRSSVGKAKLYFKPEFTNQEVEMQLQSRSGDIQGPPSDPIVKDNLILESNFSLFYEIDQNNPPAATFKENLMDNWFFVSIEIRISRRSMREGRSQFMNQTYFTMHPISLFGLADKNKKPNIEYVEEKEEDVTTTGKGTTIAPKETGMSAVTIAVIVIFVILFLAAHCPGFPLLLQVWRVQEKAQKGSQSITFEGTDQCPTARRLW